MSQKKSSVGAVREPPLQPHRSGVYHEKPPCRRPLRLPTYDYTQPGAYFVTLCVPGRECVLGEVQGGEMYLSEYGKIVSRCWEELPGHYASIELDAFVVMPTHVHGIVVIVGAGLKPAPTGQPLTEVIRAFKTFSAREINQLRHTPGVKFWQRGYYEHVIRNEPAMARIRDYIITNPVRGELDRENLHARGEDEFDRWLASFNMKPRTK